MQEPLQEILSNHSARVDALEQTIDELQKSNTIQQKLLKNVLTLLISSGSIKRSELVKLLEK